MPVLLCTVCEMEKKTPMDFRMDGLGCEEVEDLQLE